MGAGALSAGGVGLEPASPNCLSLADLERIVRGVAPAGTGQEHMSSCTSCIDRLDVVRENVRLGDRLKRELDVATLRTATGALPEHIGTYEVVRELGRGGMGTVLLARQSSPSRLVAVKLLHPFALTSRALKRFEVEVEALALLNHPNIARIYESGVFEDRGARLPYFAMELVSGRTLEEWLAERRPDLRERLRLFLQVVDAVRETHRRGILHRDLTPRNVLVEDESGQPKVIDFGLAKELAGEGSAATHAGQVLGTPAFMSPEQASGEGAIDTRTDVHGLGCLLYFLLTGVPPFPVDGLPLQRVLRAVREEDPVPPSRAVPGTPRVLDWIVQRALEKDPDARYPSADALARDVRAFLEDRRVDAAPRTAGYRARLLWRRHRVLATSALAVALAVAAGSAGTLRGVLREARAAERAVREAEISAEVRAFLVELFQEGDPHVTGGPPRSASDVVKDGAQRILEAMRDRPHVRAPLLEDLSDILRHLGEYADAGRLAREALDLRMEMEGERSVAVAEDEERLALALSEAGDLAEAIPLFRRSLETRRAALGADDPELLRVTAHLGAGLARSLRPQEAELAFAEAARLAALGGSAAYARSLAGASLVQAGELLRAEQTLEEALALCEGPDERLARAEIRTSLGAARARAGKLEQARADLEHALEDMLAVYGEVHPRTLAVRAELAYLASSEGRPQEAELELRTVVDASAADSAHGRSARTHLAELLRSTGKAAEAAATLEPLHARMTELDLAEPIRYLSSYYLARAYFDLGRFEEAIPLVMETIEGWGESEQASYSVVADARSLLGAAYSRLGRYTDVVAGMEPSLEAADRAAELDPRFGIAYRLELASAKQQCGDLEGCMAACEPAIPWCDRAGPDHLPSLQLRHLLAWCLMQSGRGEEAIPHLRIVVERRRALLGPEHFETLQSENGLAHLVGLHGDPEEALERYADLLPRAAEALGADSDDVAWFRLREVELLQRLGRTEDARRRVESALAEAGPRIPTRAGLERLAGQLARTPGGE